MEEYVVRWEIEVSASSSTDAAERALEMISDPNSIAHVFLVTDSDGFRDKVDLDLSELEALS